MTRSPASGHSGRSPIRTQVFWPSSSGYGRDEDWSACAFAAVSARGGVQVSRRDVNDLGTQEETAAADVDPGQQSAAGPTRRAAVVIHPAKHDDMDGFRAVVRTAMAELGWAEPLWLETRPDDTGERLAREAVRSGVDLVLASGGDGTVTACVGGVAGSGVPLGVLPCGTGNLLARNLGLPLSLDEALTAALTGSDRRLDVGMANGRPFVVMAGIGFDAEMLEGTSDESKKHMGWAAYVLSALRHLGDRPARVVLRVDSCPPRRRWASGVIIGNVGSLQGNVVLLPGAVPDDGVLDVAVLAARGWAGWLRLAADVLLRRRTGRLGRLACRELLVDAGRAWSWQVDGEVAGFTRQLRVTLQPGNLLLRVPATARRLSAGLSALPRPALGLRRSSKTACRR
jgi:diacylglycerol kinase family enzyme